MSGEQGSYVIIVDNETCPTGEMAEAHPMDCGCAWCLVETGQDLGNGSHGICEYHATVQYEQYRASRHVA